MKYASSIRYGGQLVEAVDCDYEDYKYLGLLCPNCKEPIFLQKQSSRTLEQKIIIVPPHFKHFSTKDPALAKQCEARVAKYDQKELERRAASTRNQRLKILQRWFWKIFTSDFIISQVKDVFPHPSDYWTHENKLLIPELAKVIVSQSQQQVKEFLAKRIDDIVSETIKYEHKELNDQIKRLSGLDLRFHKLVCYEVMQFLFAVQNRAVLTKSLDLLIYLTELSPSMSKEINRSGSATKILELTYNYLINTIVLIDWAEEFAIISKTRPEISLMS